MSAVILAVIVIMWAVVLVPMWLRRHDAATESRSVDRFSTAMRVLSRRQPGPDRRYVLMPKREQRASVHVSGASAPHRRPPARTAPAGPPPRPKTRPSLAVRRRRTLLGLVGIACLFFVLAIAGVVGWPLQLVVDLIVGAFVVHLRTQAKRAAEIARQRRVRQRPAVARPVAAAARPVARAAAPAVPAAATVGQPVPYAEPGELVESAATGTDDRWEPVPVPPPTYTMKPKAPQRWTYSSTPAADPGAEAQPPAAAQSPAAQSPAAQTPVAQPPAEPGDAVAEAGDSELDGILEHRWAVND